MGNAMKYGSTKDKNTNEEMCGKERERRARRCESKKVNDRERQGKGTHSTALH